MNPPYNVFDDLLPQELADKIESLLLNDVKWKFISDITYEGQKRKTPAFSHVFKNIEWSHDESPLLFELLPIIEEGTKLVNFKCDMLAKCRSFLQIPLHNNYSDVAVDSLHTDQPFPHLVLLYYVMDADGETIIVDKRLSTGENVITDLDYSSHPELIRVTPKKNRLVVFDGRYYHTAEQPKKGLRCIINFNLLGGFNE